MRPRSFTGYLLLTFPMNVRRFAQSSEWKPSAARHEDGNDNFAVYLFVILHNYPAP